MIKVTLLPDKKNIRVNEGTTILEVLGKVGINIDTSCGGKGTCGKCKVLVRENIADASPLEEKFLSPEEIKKGFRLACQTKLYKNSVVEISNEIRLDFKKVFSSNLKGEVNHLDDNFALDSKVKKVFLDLGKPSLEDQRSDWERIKDGLSAMKVGDVLDWKESIEILRELPYVIREAAFKVTITILNDDEVIDIECGNTTQSIYGMAFDIGTTTVAGYLIDLRSGEELSAAAKTNPQIIYGADVISRIEFVQRQKDGLEKLQREIVDTLNELIKETTRKAKIDKDNIYEAVIVGNTCMHHLFLGLSPVNLAPSPYIPVIREGLDLKVKDVLELSLNSTSHIYMLPNISAFVGADVVGDILSTSMWRENKTVLLIDLGTNGEIVLSYKEELWACSAAAGPAFEGSRISSGMRATEGAINKVKITNNSLSWQAIDHNKARGICGSGLIDLIAELLKLGLINKSGKLINREDCSPEMSEEIKKRIIKEKEGNKFLLAKSDETIDGKPVYLTQKDIREVQLAKGAISAGIKILLKEVNLVPEDIQEVLLAGAFGNFVNKKSARRVGLVPYLPLEKVRLVGNAAGRGAEIALLSKKMREISEEVSRKVKYIELSSRPDFQDEFVQALFF